MNAFLSGIALPVVAVQAMWVRRSTEVLPPAAGPSSGVVGDGPAEPLRLAVLGESTAAGCGVDSHDDGFTGALARELAGRTRRPVAWQVVGQNGATSRRIRHRLPPELGGDFDLAVLLAGANDVLSRRAPAEWRADLTAIVEDLGARATQVAVAGIPPFREFPSLPGTLARYLARRATVLDAVAAQVCAERPGVTWVGSTDSMPIGPDFFARDRFHPSSSGYGRWALSIAEHLEPWSQKVA